MKRKRRVRFPVTIVFLVAICVAQTVYICNFDAKFALGALAVTAVVLLLSIFGYKKTSAKISKLLAAAAQAMGGEEPDVLNSFPAPVAVLSKSGRIEWVNTAFSRVLPTDRNVLGTNICSIIGDAAYDTLTHLKTCEVSFADKIFKADFLENGKAQVIYLTDQTKLKKTAYEYKASRPVVALLAIDSLDEILKDAKDSVKAQVCGAIQNRIEKWFLKSGGIIRPLSNDRFMLVFEKRSLDMFEEEKFSILETVRNFEITGYKSLTLSIGVGYGGKNIHECEQIAKKALDMSLGRGGDQAAVKFPDNDYKFYGGVKAVAEKGTRVRTRVIASALCELIDTSSNVLVMGHRFSDLDSVGAAFSLASVVSERGIEAYAVIDRENTMASSLISHIDRNGKSKLFCSVEKAMQKIDGDTLLIICDTHRPNFLESKQIYEKCKRVVVIDHHRRATDYIKNSLIFYNETVTSSTCELVSELLQYMSVEKIGKVLSDALLSGIMLDTKNFVLNTGVRTFEAAAFLKRNGADPIAVKKLFADSVEQYKDKYEVIRTADIFKNCVVAVCANDLENSRLISSQAADELMSVEGAKASFVLFRENGHICICARSYGDMNVQIVMENMGGGGHRTMAACSFGTDSFDVALNMLKNEILKYDQER